MADKPNFKKSMDERPRNMSTLSEAHLPECVLRDRNLDKDTRARIGCTCDDDMPDWTR